MRTVICKAQRLKIPTGVLAITFDQVLTSAFKEFFHKLTLNSIHWWKMDI